MASYVIDFKDNKGCNMKALPTPENIRQCTTQIDKELYASIKSLAAHINVKTYILINKMLLAGAEHIIKDYKDLFKNSGESFSAKEMTTLRKILREKGL